MAAIPPSSAARLLDGGRASPIGAAVLDISARGVRICADRPLRAGDQLEMEFLLPDCGTTVRGRAEVLRAEPMPGAAALWQAGCRLRKVDRAASTALRRFVVTRAVIA